MLRTFVKMKIQYIKTEMEYPFNFWMMLISGVLTRIVSLAIPFVIYSNIPSIEGWKRTEIYLIMSFLFIAEGTCSVAFEGIWSIPSMVFDGQFDCVLSRPISPLLQVLSYGMGLHGIAQALFGVGCLIYCLKALSFVSVGAVVMSILMAGCGIALCMSMYLIGNSLVFWFDSGGSNSVAYAIASLGQFARYPVTIYHIVIQGLLLFLIPYGFIGEIPVRILRGENVLWYSLALVGITVLFLYIGRTVFYRGIRHYESMGM